MMNDKLRLAWTLLLALADSVGAEYDRDTGEALAYVAGLIWESQQGAAAAGENAAKTVDIAPGV